MRIAEFQARIEALYGAKDRSRGIAGTFLWFAEEVGELASALNKGADRAHLEAEFADVFAWLATLASLSGIDLERASRKYGDGCPHCRATPCACPEPLRPARVDGPRGME